MMQESMALIFNLAGMSSNEKQRKPLFSFHFCMNVRFIPFHRKSFIILAFLCLTNILAAQNAISFQKLTVSNGLNDGLIISIGQDKFGFMWFGTVGGVNRFNGRDFTWFTHQPGKPTSPLSGFAEAMAYDSSGRFWIGFETGLMQFDDAKQELVNIPALNGYRVNAICAIDSQQLLIASSAGLLRINAATKQMEKLSDSSNDSLFRAHAGGRIYDLYKKDDWVYIAAAGGLWKYHLLSDKAIHIPVEHLKGSHVRAVCVDPMGQIWLGTHGEHGIIRVDKAGKSHSYQRYLLAQPQTIRNNVNTMRVDGKGILWVATTSEGLLQYLPEADSFRHHRHQQALPQSISGDLQRTLFVDRDGTIWTGGNRGINFFHPDKQLFQTYLPFDKDLDKRNRSMARSITEDSEGNLWMASFDGISRFDIRTGTYKEWRNEPNKADKIWYNSVRGVLTDRDNFVWIATGAGINRIHAQKQQMEFIPHEKLPHWFYFNVNRDRNGWIWFACRDGDGFFWYDPADQSYHKLREHPKLKEFAGLGGRVLFHDSKGRYWLGLNGNGLGYYDPESGRTRYFRTSDSVMAIAGDLVTDIKEDKNGIIWVATHTGLSGIDMDNNKVQIFQRAQGMLSNSTYSIEVDELNRIWVATSRGINLIETDRISISSFDTNDGLPTDEFWEHAGYSAHNGDIIFPSVNGYVRFNPLRYQTRKAQLLFYLSGVSVFNKPYKVDGNLADLQQLAFAASENYFTLSLTSLNYEHPGQSWYAYQLEGFDKDWVITRQPEAHYTNVPGGSYRFRYKASSDPNNWDVPEKWLVIQIATPLYRQTWFLTTLLLLTASAAWYLYRRRKRKREEMLQLRSKSQLLEKEKALVMYESLKQQLNPHFLFNSLSSLRSLIRANPQEAGQFLDGLSRTYRYILQSRDTETVSLGDELRFAETYLQLQLTRFPRGLEWRNQIPADLHSTRIVPVTIQNLMENAIKHNRIDPESPLRIEVLAEDNYLVVRNNIQKKEFVETSNRQGLRYLQTLYGYMTDQPLRIEETEQYFAIYIPLLEH
jgi:ligand-binding sensor domain-containing protein